MMVEDLVMRAFQVYPRILDAEWSLRCSQRGPAKTKANGLRSYSTNENLKRAAANYPLDLVEVIQASKGKILARGGDESRDAEARIESLAKCLTIPESPGQNRGRMRLVVAPVRSIRPSHSATKNLAASGSCESRVRSTSNPRCRQIPAFPIPLIFPSC